MGRSNIRIGPLRVRIDCREGDIAVSSGAALSAKLMNETVPFATLLNLQGATPAVALIEFRKAITQAVRFRTFQKADDIADGLAYVWNEAHKWNKIATLLSLEIKQAKSKLNSIAIRRDAIVHNADYDNYSGNLMSCDPLQAAEVVRFISQAVSIMDSLSCNS